MKRKGIVCVALWLAVLGSSNVWANVFPYEVEVENRESNEEYLYMTAADVEINSESCPALEETVNAWAKERAENRETLKIQYMEMAEAEKKPTVMNFMDTVSWKHLPLHAQMNGY